MNKSLLVLSLALCVSLALGAAIDKEVIANDDEVVQPFPPLPPPLYCPARCLYVGVYELPHFRNCNQFYQCVHGFLFVQNCPPGESYDHISLSCLPVAESRCIFQGRNLA